jgi:antitoxin VapB
MGKEYTGKSFKSGNSIAIRVPAALGIEPGCEWTVKDEAGTLVLTPKSKAPRKFNIAKVAGSAKNLEFIKDEDRVFEPRPLLWDDIEQP